VSLGPHQAASTLSIQLAQQLAEATTSEIKKLAAAYPAKAYPTAAAPE
jgi:hypothetical protein